MRFSVAALSAAALPFVSAYITGLAPFTGTYKADELTTMFPVTFNTGSTKVSFSDLSVNFGLSTPAEHTGDTVFGKPLINVDLVQFKRDSVCCSPFTINIPLNSGDLYNGAGAYVLTAAIVRTTGNGSPGQAVFRADPFTVTFNATTA
ncbi:hypothetical protein AURDEDRAFT_129393 [Auricularia subglabra TFB-10046 SS5]|uniref:Uncharacterized protein n=1 Tax=Auricularia subglabra (strain TFB-10046 / SS5) TaxID=717982 RepID=J0WUC4_AURST|nr:hypothetical protein AURDEDRAFT_129393 [Auricularia subglabra TFB-10046 SS5]